MTTAQPHPTEISGASLDQRQLIRTRAAARQLRLRQQGRRFGQQTGSHPAPFKGRGLSFQQLRAYQGGDEIRHIDWRVTARTTKPHTRIFEEERERPIVLCLDQRSAMAFGSRRCFKSVLACHAAALLAWNGLESNDRVGGLIFNDGGHSEIRPRRSQRAVLHFLHEASRFNQQLLTEQAAEVGNLANALEELRRITRPGSSVFILSDFSGYDAAAQRQLHLLARHNEIIALVIADPLEEQLPLRGLYPLSNGREQGSIRITDSLRQRYCDDYRERRHQLHDNFRRSGIHHIDLSTDGDLLQTLQRGMRLT